MDKNSETKYLSNHQITNINYQFHFQEEIQSSYKSYSYQTVRLKIRLQDYNQCITIFILETGYAQIKKSIQRNKTHLTRNMQWIYSSYYIEIL